MNKKASKIVESVFIGSVLLLFALVGLLGIKIEGILFPVTTQLQIIDIIEDSNDFSRVYGDFKKLRDCDIKKVEWFYGDRMNIFQNETVVETKTGSDFISNETASKLSVGQNQSNYLMVRLSQESILNNSYAYVYHKCYGPISWTTRTLFYDSDLK